MPLLPHSPNAHSLETAAFLPSTSTGLPEHSFSLASADDPNDAAAFVLLITSILLVEKAGHTTAALSMHSET